MGEEGGDKDLYTGQTLVPKHRGTIAEMGTLKEEERPGAILKEQTSLAVDSFLPGLQGTFLGSAVENPLIQQRRPGDGWCRSSFSLLEMPHQIFTCATEAEKRETLAGEGGNWQNFIVFDKPIELKPLQQAVSLALREVKNENILAMYKLWAGSSSQAGFKERGAGDKLIPWLLWVGKHGRRDGKAFKDWQFWLDLNGKISSRSEETMKSVRYEIDRAVHVEREEDQRLYIGQTPALFEAAFVDEQDVFKALDFKGMAKRMPVCRLVFVRDAEGKFVRMVSASAHFSGNHEQIQPIIERVLKNAGLKGKDVDFQTVLLRRNRLEDGTNIIDVASGLRVTAPAREILNLAKEATKLRLSVIATLASLENSPDTVNSGYIVAKPDDGKGMELQLVLTPKTIIVKTINSIKTALLKDGTSLSVENFDELVGLVDKIGGDELKDAIDNYADNLGRQFSLAKKGLGLLSYLRAYLPEFWKGLLSKIMPKANKFIAQGTSQTSSIDAYEEDGLGTVWFGSALSKYADLAVAIAKVWDKRGIGKKLQGINIVLRERFFSQKEFSESDAIELAEKNRDRWHADLVLIAAILAIQNKDNIATVKELIGQMGSV